jgi:hypothetical protein
MRTAGRIGSMVAACALLSGCGQVGRTAASQTILGSPSATAAAAEATPEPTVSPAPTLPAEPTLVVTTTTDTTVTYEIAVAPLPEPLDEASATARAEEIGALVGLGKPMAVWQLMGSGDWQCQWPASIDGLPIDPHFPAILLEMDANGGVVRFYRIVGPSEPKPAHMVTRSQAVKAAGGAPDSAQLVWAREPSGSESFRVVWRLDYENLQSDGERWPCVVFVDAGSGKVIETACIS